MGYVRNGTLRRVVALVAAGMVLGLGGCSLDGVWGFVRDFNPCGSLIDCSAIGGPAGYEFLTSGYEGPGVDPDIDPACTYPPYCDNDPFVPFSGGG